MRPIRCALLATEHPACGHRGGVGTYTAGLAAGLRERGCPTIELVAADDGAIWESDDGAPPVRIGSWSGPTSLRPWLASGLLDRRIAAFGCHIVETSNWGGLGAALGTGVPLVVRWSTPVSLIRPRDQLRRIASWIHHRWEVRSVSRAACNIADSRTIALIGAERYGRAPDRIILHGLGPSAKPQADQDGKGLIAIGRLEHRKGTDVLLAAWRRVPADCGWILHLVGSDQGDYASSAGPDGPPIRFHGALPEADLDAIASTCPLAIVPSRFESFGMVVLEAWRRGQAVISTDGGALREIVGDAGVVVPSEDPAALAAAITGIMADRPARQRLADLGRARLGSEFLLARSLESTLDAYRSVLGWQNPSRPDDDPR